jgi:drug/metabolite transporter (DMT)-like permease
MKKLNPVLSLLLCALLWSSGGVLIKSVAWNPCAIAGMRGLFAGIAMMILLRHVPVLLIRKADFGIDKKKTAISLGASLGYSLTMIFFVTAVKLTTSANAILLQYTYPLYVIIFAPLVLGEKNEWIDYITIVGVLAGMVFFVFDGISAGNALGNMFAFASGIAFALTTILMRKQKDGNPADSFILANIITFVAMIPFYFGQSFSDISSWVWLLTMSIFQIAMPAIFYSIGIVRVGAVSASILLILEPIMNPVWVGIFTDELPSVNAIIGGGIVLSFVLARTIVKQKGERK